MNTPSSVARTAQLPFVFVFSIEPPESSASPPDTVSTPKFAAGVPVPGSILPVLPSVTVSLPPETSIQPFAPVPPSANVPNTGMVSVLPFKSSVCAPLSTLIVVISVLLLVN